MKLILFRHGLAVERDDFQKTGQDDSLRPLVAKGRERTRQMGKELARIVPDVSVVVTSPFLRATETADILKDVLKPKKYLQSLDLIPSAPSSAFVQWLKLHINTETTVVAVGHEPQLSSFASWCLGGVNDSFIEIKKSGMLCLEIESFQDLGRHSTEMKWLLQPKLL